MRTSVVSAICRLLDKNHRGIGVGRLGGAIIVPPSTLEPAHYVVELSYSKENLPVRPAQKQISGHAVPTSSAVCPTKGGVK